ncbi:MAG: hypothetical protein ACI9XO_000795 [Paraglaciecola sp.]|jgi:hypothetical protein
MIIISKKIISKTLDTPKLLIPYQLKMITAPTDV